ncbi:Osmotically-inducible protein Y precursor [Enhygromyxa salina]|uniref:Osmotically-inducible protein Y n=2 Tax=Enhygromyxa salina TaxID=215803 RepID=A0A2S9YHH6_9BACT|nr:Osmotically-inducible protein Y precursor [Enhygromyxa salina]
MKRIISVTLLPLLLLAPVAISGCATTRTMDARADDNQLESRVGLRLSADPDIRRYEIDVDVIDGVVTLRGEVDNQRIADRAEQVAQTTEGVNRVVNKLMIESDESESESTRSDALISAAVGARLLGDPEVRRVNIDVDVVEGVVYLSGVVEDQLAKDSAERIASAVKGVIRVDNELQVQGGQPQDQGQAQGHGQEQGQGMEHTKASKQDQP